MKALLLFALLMSRGMPSNAVSTPSPPLLCQDMGCAFIPNASCQCDDMCQERAPSDCCFDFYQFCEGSEIALGLIIVLLIGGLAGAASCAFWQWCAYSKRRRLGRGTTRSIMRSTVTAQEIPPAYSRYPAHVANPVFNPDLEDQDGLLET